MAATLEATLHEYTFADQVYQIDQIACGRILLCPSRILGVKEFIMKGGFCQNDRLSCQGQRSGVYLGQKSFSKRREGMSSYSNNPFTSCLVTLPMTLRGNSPNNRSRLGIL